jgi:antibiotic biosynthesis monooxygenase (ABM) superfamily enzyme
MAETDLSALAASLVVEHVVPSGKGLAFRWWHAKLTRLAKRYNGYIRTDLYAPVKGSCPDQPLKWYSIVHFESPESLNQWLTSRDRETMIETGRKVFASYQFMSFSTGLEGWFSRETGTEHIGIAPPAWKQNLSVILGLYPTVMIQSALFAALGVMQSWSLPSSMLVNNIITSSILTWVVMPLVTRWLKFWLHPATHPSPWKTEVLGAGLIVVVLSGLLMLFNQF